MDAVEEALKHMAREKEKGGDIRLVSFRQFVDWLDVQKPDILDKLRTLDVGQKPAGGWSAFTKGGGEGGSGTPSGTASEGSGNAA